MPVVVSLSKALICFASACHPVLVGADTPTGTFALQPRQVISAGYGGDVLVITETETTWTGIHRVYNMDPYRIKLLQSDDPADRRYVSAGCINAMPAVYEQLRACCSGAQITIQP